MANDVNQYSVDLSRLTQRVNELRANETKLKAQQDALNKAFKEGKITEDNFKKATEQLTKQVQQNKVELQKMGTTVANLKKETEQSAQGIEKAFGAIWGAIQGGLAQIMNAFETFRNNQAAARAELRKNHEEVLRLREEYEKLKITLKDDAFKQELSDAKEKNDVVKEEVLLIEQLTKATDKYDKITKQLAADEKEIVNVRKEFKENFRSSAPGQRLAVLEKQIAQAYIDQANAKKAQADAERELNTFYNNQQKKADEDALKQIEERKKKEKELADQKKKAAEERAKADQDILKQLEDLQIKCIDDETERQKAQIELNKKRTIQALNEISKKASATGKKNIAEVKKLLEQINVNEIMKIDSQKLINTFSSVNVNIIEAMRRALLEDARQFDEIPTQFIARYKTEVENVYQLLSTEGSQSVEEWMVSAIDELKRYVEEGYISAEKYQWLTNDILEKTVEMTNGTVNVLKMSSDEIQDTFSKLNNSNFANPEIYKKYIDEIFGNLKQSFVDNTQTTFLTFLDKSKLELGEITKLEKVEAETKSETLKATQEYNKELRKQTEEYEKVKAEINAIAMVESNRLETQVFKSIIDAHEEYIQELKERGLIEGSELFKSELAKWERNSAEYMDYLNSMTTVAEKTSADLNAVQKSYNTTSQTLALEHQNRLTEIQQEASERRRQIMAEEFQNASTFISNMSSMFTALGDVQSSIANDESKSAKEREKARRKQLNLQIASVYLGMASSLAEGISTATSSSSNWIEMLIAIASSVAAIVSQFAQIKSLMSQKNSGGYATGGYVSGAGSGTSDSIPTNLSNGEYVINADATRDNMPLLDAINYGNANSLASQLALAVQQIPNPVVAVDTIEKVQSFKNQVSAYSHL